MEITRIQKIFLALMLTWLVFTTSLVTLAVWRNPVHRAVLGMGWGLIVLWIFVCGGIMLRYRSEIAPFVRGIRLDWRLKFVLFCTLLAMLEEAITTGMTNLAPLFGVRLGQAYITSSASYLDVIALHSVSVFVSLFVGWAVILSRYRFRPFAVFLLFGISGTVAEMLYGGPQHILEFAMWVPVYGLMIYLPACSVPEDRPARPPKWYHYPLAIFVPFLFLALFPLAGVIHAIFPHHPDPHFAPIR